MAYRPRRTASRGKAYSGRSNRTGYGGRIGRVSRGRAGVRRTATRQQTVKLVVEVAPQSAVARPEGIPQVEVPTKKSKF